MLLELIQNKIKANKKLFALLIDPGKPVRNPMKKTIIKATEYGADIVFVGGSLIYEQIDETIRLIKSSTDLPVFLFPGNLLQLSKDADGILLLSLISGRNPELLIGNHVSAAYLLKNSGIEIIPTGYIIIENGKSTSVSYMSQTTPIPADKPDIASATAIAGELLGLKMIYLEAGSGAEKPVNTTTINKVKQEINVPLIVGGGIKNINDINNICNAGADIVVVGNSIENDQSLLKPLIDAVHSFNET